MPPQGPGEPTVSLADHLAWLVSIGDVPGCTCRYEWKGRSYVDGRRRVNLGPGWIRMNTARDCPEHGPGGAAAQRERERRKRR
jgi:hypothetical protein